jgi:hypothetical protein
MNAYGFYWKRKKVRERWENLNAGVKIIFKRLLKSNMEWYELD